MSITDNSDKTAQSTDSDTTVRYGLNSLPIRLSISISTILLAFILAGMSLIAWLWFTDLSKMLNTSSLSTAKDTAYTLDTVFKEAELTAGTIAGILEQFPPQKEQIPSFLDTLLQSVNKKSPEISGIALAWCDGMLDSKEKYNFFLSLENNGKIKCISQNDGKLDYFTKDWFLVPVTLEKPVWTIPFQSEAGLNSVLLSYAIPFYNNIEGKRTLSGAVIIDIRMNTLDKFLKNSQREGIDHLSSNTKMFLTNQFGQIVISPDDPEFLSKTLFSLCDESDSPNPSERKLVQGIYKTQAGKISLKQTPILNQPCDLYYSSCVNDWVVCIAIPSNWISAILFPLFIKFLLGWLVGICCIVAVIFIICKKLNKPLVSLTEAAQKVGQGNFSAAIPTVTSKDEIGNLARSFTQMQSQLIDYITKLKDTVAARERAECELNLAKTIQQDILPRILPPFTGYTNVNGAADLIPARGVGGDLYDVFPIDEFRLAIIIGDVSGKGVPAAMFMVVTQTLQRSIARAVSQPAELVTQLNNMLASSNDANMFVTYWIGILDTRTGKMDFTSGGHNPPLIRRANGTVEWIREYHGFPLGAIANFEYNSSSFTMEPEDCLILYTDGVTEAFSADKQQFGEQRLFDTINEIHSSDPKAILDHIKSAVFDFSKGAYQSDDITILIVQCAQKNTTSNK